MDILETVKCSVCGSGSIKKRIAIEYESNKVLEALNIKEKPEVFVYKCASCGHHYANPQITEPYLQHYYSVLNSEYYGENKIYDKVSDHLKLEHKKLKQLIEKYIDGGNILEIGAGYGFFLNNFDDKKWNKFGVEPSSYAATYAQTYLNLNVTNKFLEKGLFPPKYFDVIILLDVIEHLKDPHGIFKIIEYYLKPEGYVVIGTGNISSFNSRVSKGNWTYYGSWEHISFYSPESIRLLLKMHNLKTIKIHKVSYAGTFQENIVALISNMTLFKLKNLLKDLLNYCFGKKFVKYKAPLALDHMIVISRLHHPDS